ncbi:MAG: PEP/pyruvate-binding domain-containing protein [Verrucomicrobiota bacterium]|jgi:pyruvate,water dikinase
MISLQEFTQDLEECREVMLVGGKGASLGRLIRAGFPVPNGFVVNTRAYRLAQKEAASAGKPMEIPAQAAGEILREYQTMGAGAVAVRSSATAEDMAAASMAGQCDTFLDVEGETALLEAVRRCWASLDAPRLRAYLEEHGIEPAKIAMAVVVQRLVPADVAGVLFTADPNGGGSGKMLIEANWGLGETVVGGRVQPDVLTVERNTGRVLSAKIADKQVYLAAGTGQEEPVAESLRKKSCLSSRDVHRLWELGTRIMEHFAAPQDIEWAFHDGNLYLLQSRSITTHRETEATGVVLQATRQRLREEMSAGRGPWVLHNLAETLPHPTSLTWSVIRKFMSGLGGFGAMYRQAGFQPAPIIDREGFLELVAGRIYMDVARAPEMFCENFPFAYDLEKLVRDPDASQKPPTLPRGSYSSRARAAARMSKAGAKLRQLSEHVAGEFREKTTPAVTEYAARSRQKCLHLLSAEELIALWEEHEKQVLNVFGPETLMPGLICGMAWAELEAFLQENFWDDDAEALLRLISIGAEPDRTVIADAELYEVANGKRSLETWLAAHGHRGPGEFDLAAPRWRERPAVLREMAARLAAGEPPLERYRRGSAAANQQAADLRSRLSAADAKEFDRRLDLVRRYMPFREDGKDLLMLGYGLLRDLALEAGCRLDIGDGVFHLTRDELFDALRAGFAPLHLIEQHELTYRAETRLTVPRVIDAQAVDRLGETSGIKATAGCCKGLPISAGQAAGPARILQSVAGAGELGRGYILVCPSTDPAWTPLFVNAAGLVLERGGALSHGAVVAREMGLPAVVLPDATRLFQDGEQISVNGNQGWVARALHHSNPLPPTDAIDPNDTRVPRELIPPPPGRKERQAAKLRNAAAALWMIYLLGFFFLPKEYVYQPSLSLLDLLLWPLVRFLGKPAAVAIVAAGMGMAVLLVQKFATDNRRLLEAKRRAALLVKQARSLPENAPRRKAFLQLATPVNLRVLMAAMVPVSLLLGLLVISFVWFKDRLDPSLPKGLAGSSVQVVATVSSDWSQPVRIEVPPPLALDETTPVSRTLPPIRKTLEHLLALYRQPRNQPDLPWELQVVPDTAREQTAADLQNYLDAGIPPRGITWMIRPPPGTVGRFSVKVKAEGHPPVTLKVVLGEEFPPGNLIARGGSDAPVKELRAVYPPPRQKPVFWQPLAGLGAHDQLPFAKDLAMMDIGWLWLYLLTYLPALFVSRAVLKVA